MRDLFLILPEIFLALSAFFVLIVDLYTPVQKRGRTYRLTIGALVILALYQLSLLGLPNTLLGFSGHYITDVLSRSLGFFSTLCVICALVFSRKVLLPADDSQKILGEFFPLALLALLGQLVMMSGNSLLTIYLGIELMTLSLYALVAMRRDNARAIEAATKYFILGALASGLLLYGMSMIYGATGSLLLPQINQMIHSQQANPTALVFGLVFIVAGLAFKFGLVPFHTWVPDVYQGAPMPATLLIASAPKIATFVIVLRLLFVGFFDLAKDWQQMLLIVAILSIGLGNIAAIAQSSVKRMLAYSAIAQLGFLLLGFFTALNKGGSPETFFQGFGGSFFYLFAYILASLLAFGVLLYLSDSEKECEEISQLAGLNQRHPWLALLLLLSMFSMAGIPPLVGFYGKFLVLQSLVFTEHYWVALAALFFSLIGAFYYLRIIKTMYFDAPALPITPSPRHLPSFVSLNVVGLLVIGLGLFPSGLTAYLFTVLKFSLLGVDN